VRYTFILNLESCKQDCEAEVGVGVVRSWIPNNTRSRSRIFLSGSGSHVGSFFT